jgi:hypothetical protein
MGFDAGKCLLTSDNTFIGNGAGKYTPSGTNSTYIGAKAGHNACGDKVVAIGYYAGHGGGSKTGSVFVGAHAGDEATSATCAIHIGFEAGCNVTSGVKNILIGTNLVPTLTTGDCNVIIGHGVDVASSSTSTTFAIGCGTNKWIYGDSSFNIYDKDGNQLNGVGGGGGSGVSQAKATAISMIFG